MTTIQLLEQLGADPAFQINTSMRQQILDELQETPKVSFIGVVAPEDDEDEKEQEDEKGDEQESDEKQQDDKTVN